MTGLLGLFEGYGVEIEYVIVDRSTLSVLPIADRLMEVVAGEPVDEIVLGEIAWSNELALHVLELKTNGPAAQLSPLPVLFHSHVRGAGERLAPLEGRLMPGGMHPWMDPARESRLWPHEYNEVYRALDRIFGCAGHGWTNLQSTHLNLPFANDEEFRRLHAAIRVVLPLVPALAASSPVVDGRIGRALDERLVAYRSNARRVPSVTGDVIPEPIGSLAEYRERILEPIYRDLAPLDPEGVLRHEWVNARGAIARFERGSIEIRLLDTQECPTADIAVVAAVVAAVRRLVRTVDPDEANAIPTPILAGVLDDTIREAERARIPEGPYPRLLGERGSPTAQGMWEELLSRDPGPADDPALRPALERIVERGPLARRILAALDRPPTPDALRETYRRLCDCLAADEPFG
ncbi:MAG: carboxylate-amine ligase [Gemmatimonadota bacterium]